MELDDFKKNMLYSTPKKTEQGPGQNSEVDQFIASFKSHINKQRRKVILMAIMLLVLSIIYTSSFVKETGLLRFGYGLVLTSFLLGAVYLYWANKPLPDNIYSLPVSDFLYKAEKKLKFMKLSDWLIIIPLLLTMGTGGGIILIIRLSKYTANFGLLLGIWILFFVSLVLFAFYVSKKEWEKEHGLLLREIRSLINR